MKILYVVNTNERNYIDFYGVQVVDETEKDFILCSMDKINIEEYTQTFPKRLLKYEFDMGYVTDELDKQELKRQANRIYDTLKKRAENDYQSSVEMINKCITHQEYEKSHKKS